MSSFPPEANRPEEVWSDGPGGPPLARPITPPGVIWAAVPDPMLLREVGRWGCLLDVLLLALGLIAFQVLVYLIAGWFLGADPGQVGDSRYFVVGMVVTTGMFALVWVGWITHWRRLSLTSLGLTGQALGTNLALGLAATAATFGVFALGVLGVYVFWPAGYQSLLNNPQNIYERLPRMGVGSFVGLSALVGLWEEVAFRGFLLPRVRRLTSSWVAAAVLSSAVFAVSHLEMQAGAITVPLFLIAVFWCVVTIWRRSVLPVIVAHFVFDLIQFLVLRATAPEWQ